MTGPTPIPVVAPPQTNYSGPPHLPPMENPAAQIPNVQQIPVPYYGTGHSLNTSAHYAHHNGLNASASSFNISKSDLENSVTECAESFLPKMDIDSSAASSLGNISGGSSSGGGSGGVAFNISGNRNDSGIGGGGAGSSGSGGIGMDLQKKVMLQLNNLDSSYDEFALKKFLISLLKPITPIVSLAIDGTSSAKIEVPSPHVSCLKYLGCIN